MSKCLPTPDRLEMINMLEVIADRAPKAVTKMKRLASRVSTVSRKILKQILRIRTLFRLKKDRLLLLRP